MLSAYQESKKILRVKIYLVEAFRSRDNREEPKAPGKVGIFIDFKKFMVKNADESGRSLCAVKALPVRDLS